jgi:hypothetical protein
MACRAAGSSTAAKPLSSASNAMPALAAWRFGPRRRYPRRAVDPPGRRCVQCRSRQVGRCFGGTRHATRPRWCPRSLHKAWEGPTSTDRAVLAARPAPTRASRIAASFTEIGHVVVGRHLQQFARHPVGSFLDALPRFAFHLRRLGSVKIAHVGPAACGVLAPVAAFPMRSAASLRVGAACVPTGR